MFAEAEKVPSRRPRRANGVVSDQVQRTEDQELSRCKF